VAGDAGSVITGGLSYLRRVLRMQDGRLVSHAISVSTREASLELELAGGRTQTMALRGGDVLIDGRRVAGYEAGGALDRAWRRLLADGASLDSPQLEVALRNWRVPGLTATDAAAKSRLDAAVRALLAERPAPSPPPTAQLSRADTAGRAMPAPVTITLADLELLDSLERHLAALQDVGPEIADAVRMSPMHLGDFSIPAGTRSEGDVVVFRGDAEVRGEVAGHVVALYGDVRHYRGAVIGGSAVSVGGEVTGEGTVRGDIKTVSAQDLAAAASELEAPLEPEPLDAAPSTWSRLVTDVRNVIAVFVALAMLGFGTVFFARRQLEVVADTASHCFGRALVVGLLGQLLLLPTFAMLIVGLALTVVGLLIVPFAAALYVVAACLAVLGGYLAVAHAIGETFARRRMANGAFVRAPNAYGYLFSGLVGLLGLWAAAALFGWAGPVLVLLNVAAGIATWVAATVGFGAVLLSRAGLRETFAGRYTGELSDEYLWATPPATPTVRPGQRR
jgi:hypothetical protein